MRDNINNPLLLEYLNNSYKEDQAVYMRKLYQAYTGTVGGMGILTYLTKYANKGNTTALSRMFVKQLLEVFTLGKSDTNFDIYASTIDNEKPSGSSEKLSVKVDDRSPVFNSRENEFIHLLKTVGIANTIYIVHTLKKL